MADRLFVLNNVLCFLSCRFGKSAVKCLKSAILDFYSLEELIDAKRQLLQDAKSLQSVDTMPQNGKRVSLALEVELWDRQTPEG